MEDIDTDHLISLVEERPLIWNKRLPKYKDRCETRNAWREIFLELRPNFDDLKDIEKNSFSKKVMKKWGNVRDTFKKSLRKQKNAAATQPKGYIYNDRLKFLSKASIDCETDNSFKSIEDDEDVFEKNLQDTTVSRANAVKAVSKEIPQKKRKIEEVGIEMIKALRSAPDRHMCFFQGIVPSLQSFDEDDILDFQTSVLQAIRSIKSRKNKRSQLAYICNQQSKGLQTNLSHSNTNMGHSHTNMGGNYSNKKNSYPTLKDDSSAEETVLPFSVESQYSPDTLDSINF